MRMNFERVKLNKFERKKKGENEIVCIRKKS